MTWLTRHQYRTRVSTKDIKVYTYAVATPDENLFQAILERRMYRLGKFYYQDLKTPQKGQKGLYEMDTGMVTYDPEHNTGGIESEDINETLIKALVPDRRIAKLSCVIPAGSRYAVNEVGEYVSDKLFVKDFEIIRE